MNQPLAPGARVLIRDEEWLVRRIDPSADGGELLTCDGVSDLVRGRGALFLTKLEGKPKVLDPALTELAADASSHFDWAMQYLESQRQRSTPNDQAIHLGHRGVMNLVPYQLDPAIQALRQPRTRIFHQSHRLRRVRLNESGVRKRVLVGLGFFGLRQSALVVLLGLVSTLRLLRILASGF